MKIFRTNSPLKIHNKLRQETRKHSSRMSTSHSSTVRPTGGEGGTALERGHGPGKGYGPMPL